MNSGQIQTNIPLPIFSSDSVYIHSNFKTCITHTTYISKILWHTAWRFVRSGIPICRTSRKWIIYCEKQIFRCFVEEIQREIKTVEQTTFQRDIQWTGSFPFQILIRNLDFIESTDTCIYIRIEKLFISIIVSTSIITYLAIRYTELQVVYPRKIFHKFLLRNDPACT